MLQPQQIMTKDFGNLVAKKLKKYNKLTQNIIQNEILAIFLNTDRIYSIPSILFKYLYTLLKNTCTKYKYNFRIFCFIIIKYSTFSSHYFSYPLRPYSVQLSCCGFERTSLSLIHVCVSAISVRLTTFDLIGNFFIF